MFTGLQNCFEQELITDESSEYNGKYKVNIKAVGKNLFSHLFAEELNKCSIAACGSTGRVILNGELEEDYVFYINVPIGNYKASCSASDNSVIHIMYNDSDILFNEFNVQFKSPKLIKCYIPAGTYSNRILTTLQIESGNESTIYEECKENNLNIYLNEPLRGIDTIRDVIRIKDDKIVVERNCASRPYQDGDFGLYPTDKVTTVYQLVDPVYEDVICDNDELSVNIFKDTTLFYKTNVPVTSKINYSYSLPITDTLTNVANVTDQQDAMIIDLATQCAILEMMTL